MLVWVSYYLQDGTQTGCTDLEIKGVHPEQEIDEILMARHGDMYGGVADWDEYEDVDDEPTGNMPCDNTGFCGGTSCPMYFKCQADNIMVKKED